MKLSLPLYARISGWFILNLLLIVIVVFFFSRQYFSMESLIAGPAGDRITTLAERAGENLTHHNEQDWPSILAQLGDQHELSYTALGNDGNPFIEGNFTPPDAVLEELRKFSPPPRDKEGGEGRHRAPPNPDHRPPPRDRGFGPEGNFLDFDPPDRSDRSDNQQAFPQENELFNENEKSSTVRSHLLFAVQDHQGNYWFANRLQLGPPRVKVRRPASMILLIKSSSLGANGLILDTSPWWKLGGIILGISILLWVPFAWNITHYIRRLTRRTVSIARGNFEANEITHRGDELGHLGIAIDRLRQRLKGYMDGQKRFTSDIAHELCTPLARMQLSLGLLEQQQKASPQIITDLRDEVQQMSGMVEELLDFSRASIRPDQVTLEKVNLRDLIKEVIKREGASMAQIDIRENLEVNASPHLLRRALGNIVRNAMLHAPGKEIFIHTFSMADNLEIFIDDDGPGIPEEDLPRIFEPFYRVDSARTREDGGTGLGLAIVGTCMEGCNGTASCENIAKGGLRVILTLPQV